ncbi:MAG: helix-turn-helix transcriptional regulator [Vicingus serpentipes]|nr:helix-turn-helix transcriptional regulator [Vicingus serpentipes]
MIHIGKIIERQVEQSGMTKAAFADRIGKTRNTVYDIFSRTTIDTDLLKKISEALHYDFFQHYKPEESDFIKSVAKEGAANYEKKQKKKSRLSLMIELDPDDDILLNEDFTKKLKELMRFVS